jgi:hypothetical protein
MDSTFGSAKRLNTEDNNHKYSFQKGNSLGNYSTENRFQYFKFKEQEFFHNRSQRKERKWEQRLDEQTSIRS